jgi:Uma2 family endonuclease
MAATIAPKRATEDDLRRCPKDGRKYELVGGSIAVSPAGWRHGRIAAELLARLWTFLREQPLGHLVDSSTGFRLPSGNVRSPDVSFVARGRMSSEGDPEDFATVPPDLAVEVLSPGDRPQNVLDKVGEYLEAGVRLVWVIDPQGERAVAYRSLSDVVTLGPDDDLDGGDVLPGFRCRLRDVLV